MFNAIMKPFTAAILIMFGFAAFVSGQVCTPAPVGLVSWWSGDGNALDSRSRNNGTLQSDATFAAGHVGQAFSLDGLDDIVTVGNPTTLNFGTGNFSIQAWVRTSFLGGTFSDFIVSKSSVGNDAQFILGYTAGTTGFPSFLMSDGTTISTAGGTASIADGIFHHLAGIREGTTLRLYVDGVQVGTATTPALIDTASPNNVVIGGRDNPDFDPFFNGIIDEVQFYTRALSAAEIQAIFNAGTAGMCKPTATVAPSGLVGWWAGDGNANDTAGTNNGTLQNGAGFAVGRVGQAFSLDGINDHISVANNASLNVQTGNFAVEAWVNLQNVGATNSYSFIAGKDGCGNANIYALGATQGSGAQLRLINSSGGDFSASAGTPLTTNVWHHLVGVRDGSTLRIYVDGVQVGTAAVSGTFNTQTFPFTIGERPANGDPSCRAFVNGSIDEVSLYNRALTQDEIKSIFHAGIAGKLKQSATSTGFAPVAGQKSKLGNRHSDKLKDIGQVGLGFQAVPETVNASVGDATITFPTVTTAGTTQQIPLLGSVLPPLPMGTHTGLIYDIATTAAFIGSPTVCFNPPSFNSEAFFANLRVLHLEAGVWENRTTTADFATRSLCSQVSSLSPFAISSLGVSAAPASIAGRVVTGDGRGISRVVVTVEGDGLESPRFTRTNVFGYFRLGDLATGQGYVLSVTSKRYVFDDPVRLIHLSGDISDVNFIVASP